jgi:NAD(P)-dependent dehydrogenase (short-subunit alcohol dehydrogenase family)
MPRRLEDRVCVITGTATGAGYATALLFAEHGATVVGVDIEGALGRACATAVGERGGASSFIEGDVSDPALSEQVAQHCEREYGRCDVLFNNAAVVVSDTVETFDLANWNRVFQVNVIGPLLFSRALAPLLAVSGRGSIINHSSIDGIYGNPHVASYSASKAALDSLTRLMAHTYAAQGIRTNSIASGNISRSRGAPAPRRSGGLIETDPELRERLLKQVQDNTPGGRVGTAEDAADVALFFATDDSVFVNGVSLLVSGGRGALTPGTTVS